MMLSARLRRLTGLRHRPSVKTTGHRRAATLPWRGHATERVPDGARQMVPRTYPPWMRYRDRRSIDGKRLRASLPYSHLLMATSHGAGPSR